MREKTSQLLDSIFSCDLKGKVITIIGPAGLGKSTFACMQLPAYIYINLKEKEEITEDTKFYLINTDYSLIPDRLLEVLNEFKISFEEFKKYLKVEYIYKFDEQDKTVKAIFQEAMTRADSNVPFIAIDPFNHILRIEYAKAPKDYRLNVVGRLSPTLEHQLNLLMLLARKKGTTVVLTMLPKKAYVHTIPRNWQQAFFGPIEIAHFSDIVLWFSQSVQSERGITVTVMKHRLKETPYQVECKLTKGGLMKI